MAKLITLGIVTLAALAGCNNYSTSYLQDSARDVATSAAVGAVAGGTTNLLLGSDPADGALAGAVGGVASSIIR